MDNFLAHTEDITDFGSRLAAIADTVARAQADAARHDHTPLSAVLGLIAEDFVRVTGEAQQTQIDDLGRLATVVSSAAAATHSARDLYVAADESVRAAIVEAART
ncbi:hypothetical protein ACFRFQ_15825 [Rhodococcus sp. NPDC056743]|uniref:hypothetical protein n=1 Tax=Rhodococcus sp. NPDC056743 TaxID=3345934 RepID=UPI00367057BB